MSGETRTLDDMTPEQAESSLKAVAIVACLAVQQADEGVPYRVLIELLRQVCQMLPIEYTLGDDTTPEERSDG